MKPFLQLSALGPGTKALLGFVVVSIGVAAIFDWNWVRGPLVRYLAEKSGREVRIDDLDVTLARSLEPTVRLRGVRVENAPWAAGNRPMAVAGEARFTFSMRSLLQRRPIISRLVLLDADVDLQRQADGSRNWRLLNPEDREPGRIRVMTLEAQRSTIRFANRGIGLELDATSTPVASPVAGAHHREPLSNRIALTGSYRGEAFAGEALAGALLSFRESGISFPSRGHVAAGKTRVEFDGVFTDIYDLAAMDAGFRVSGPTLSKLHPFVDFHPADSRPYQFAAQISQRENEYTISRLHGKIGATDIAGEVSYSRGGERPSVRATLNSVAADLADLGSLAGIDYRGGSASVGSRARERVFPVRAISGKSLGIVDAHLTVNAKRLRAADVPALDSLRFTAQLSDGALLVKPFDLGVAGGHVQGSLEFNGKDAPPSARVALDASGVRLEKLAPELAARARSAGSIRARIRLAGQGNSVAAIFGAAAGSFAAVMERGSVSNLADAKLGLNVGKAIGLRLRGDQDIAINCGAIAFDFRDGKGRSQIILLDTEQTRVDGAATVDLRKEEIVMMLNPRPKNPGLLTLSGAVAVQGPLRHPRVSVERDAAPDGSSRDRARIDALFRGLVAKGQPASACAAFLGPKAQAAAVSPKE